MTKHGLITWLKLTNGDPPRRSAPLCIFVARVSTLTWRGGEGPILSYPQKDRLWLKYFVWAINSENPSTVSTRARAREKYSSWLVGYTVFFLKIRPFPLTLHVGPTTVQRYRLPVNIATDVCLDKEYIIKFRKSSGLGFSCFFVRGAQEIACIKQRCGRSPTESRVQIFWQSVRGLTVDYCYFSLTCCIALTTVYTHYRATLWYLQQNCNDHVRSFCQ